MYAHRLADQREREKVCVQLLTCECVRASEHECMSVCLSRPVAFCSPCIGWLILVSLSHSLSPSLSLWLFRKLLSFKKAHMHSLNHTPSQSFILTLLSESPSLSLSLSLSISLVTHTFTYTYIYMFIYMYRAVTLPGMSCDAPLRYASNCRP